MVSSENYRGDLERKNYSPFVERVKKHSYGLGVFSRYLRGGKVECNVLFLLNSGRERYNIKVTKIEDIAH